MDQHQLFEPLILISRALTDSHFGKFLLKIPSVFIHYNAKCQKKLTELDIRVKRRIRDLYWGRYIDFREAFNLKLNYSLKLESGINLVHLVKRGDRKMFKMTSEFSEVSIRQIEIELDKDNDTSFISDDLFNKSLTSLVGLSTFEQPKEESSM